MTETRQKRQNGQIGETAIRRIDRRTIWEQAYAILRAQILDGQLAPGTLLNLRDLAAQLSVSVTPVRDAVLRLMADGLIEGHESRGLRVAQLLESEIEQTLDLRILLEIHALEQSAPKLMEDDFKQLETLLEAAEKLLPDLNEGSGQRYMELGREFHRYLIEASDNKPLLDLYERLHPQAFLLIERSHHGFPPHRNREDHLEHKKVFEALRRRDYPTAIQHLKEHLEHVRKYTLEAYHTRAEDPGDIPIQQ